MRSQILNAAIIQQTFYGLLGFASELKNSYPNPPEPWCDWKIELDEHLSAFRLRISDTLFVYLDHMRDEYTIYISLNALKPNEKVCIADALTRELAQAFLARSLGSKNFPAGCITAFEHNEAAADLIESLLATQFEKVG